jgi:hypothetical protein
MPRQVLQWFFRNRQTGAITVAQAPNPVSWIVIIAAVARWIGPSAGTLNLACTVVVTGGLIVWAVDEIVRGVNPWRRCLGTAVWLTNLRPFFDGSSGMATAHPGLSDVRDQTIQMVVIWVPKAANASGRLAVPATAFPPIAGCRRYLV